MKNILFLFIGISILVACCKPDEQIQAEPVPQSCVTLISPVNGSPDQASKPVFNWRSTCISDTFKIQISLDKTFTNPDIGYDTLVVGKDYEIPNNHYGFPYSRTIYWRVIPYHDTKNTLASTVFSYKTIDKRDDIIGAYACKKSSILQRRVAGGFTREEYNIGASNITVTKHPTIDGGILVKETNTTIQNDYNGSYDHPYIYSGSDVACWYSASFLTGANQDSFDVYINTLCSYPFRQEGFRYRGKMR